jgi:hypothetical protein
MVACLFGLALFLVVFDLNIVIIVILAGNINILNTPLLITLFTRDSDHQRWRGLWRRYRGTCQGHSDAYLAGHRPAFALCELPSSAFRLCHCREHHLVPRHGGLWHGVPGRVWSHRDAERIRQHCSACDYRRSCRSGLAPRVYRCLDAQRWSLFPSQVLGRASPSTKSQAK